MSLTLESDELACKLKAPKEWQRVVPVEGWRSALERESGLLLSAVYSEEWMKLWSRGHVQVLLSSY